MGKFDENILSFLSAPSISTVFQEIDKHQTSGGGWLDRVFTDDGSLDRGNLHEDTGTLNALCLHM